MTPSNQQGSKSYDILGVGFVQAMSTHMNRQSMEDTQKAAAQVCWSPMKGKQMHRLSRDPIR